MRKRNGSRQCPQSSAELLQLRSAGIHRNPGGAAAVGYPAGQFEFVRQPQDRRSKTDALHPSLDKKFPGVPCCLFHPVTCTAKVALPVYRVCYALPAQFNL